MINRVEMESVHKSHVHFMATYRPEIDGLRAVAILSVVFFHAGLFSLPGGFFGVDIF